MALSGKALLIILVIMMIVSLSLASIGAYLFQQQIQKSKALDKQVSEALIREKKFASSLQSSRQDVERLNTLFSQSGDNIKSLNSEIASLESEKKILAAKVAEFEEEFKTTSNKNVNLLKTVDDLKTALYRKERQLEVVNKERGDLAKRLEKVGEAKSKVVRLEKILIAPRRPSLEGKIVSINKKFNFLIIDRGKTNQVKIGDIFSCFYKQKEIGQVEIEKVYKTLSAANFLPGLGVKYLKQGSRVLRK